MSSDFIRAYDLQEAIEAQLKASSAMTEELPSPQGQDDEQWMFPYGRISYEANTSHNTDYGVFSGYVSLSGIVEESASCGSSRLFLDKNGVDVHIEDPEGECYELEWAIDDITTTVSELSGGYSFWCLPISEYDDTFVSYLFYEPEGDAPGASLIKYFAEAFAQQENYRQVMR